MTDRAAVSLRTAAACRLCSPSGAQHGRRARPGETLFKSENLTGRGE